MENKNKKKKNNNNNSSNSLVFGQWPQTKTIAVQHWKAYQNDLHIYGSRAGIFVQIFRSIDPRVHHTYCGPDKCDHICFFVVEFGGITAKSINSGCLFSGTKTYSKVTGVMFTESELDLKCKLSLIFTLIQHETMDNKLTTTISRRRWHEWLYQIVSQVRSMNQIR